VLDANKIKLLQVGAANQDLRRAWLLHHPKTILQVSQIQIHNKLLELDLPLLEILQGKPFR
jgi:hypothetical protein